MTFWRVCAVFAVILIGLPAHAEPLVLVGASGVEALFEQRDGAWRWSAYRDPQAARAWPITGRLFSIQEPDGERVDLGDIGFSILRAGDEHVVLTRDIDAPALSVRLTFRFCDDGRTLRMRAAIRAMKKPLTIQRVGLLEVRVAGEAFERKGPELVSSPIFSERLFAGVEHPSAWCQVAADQLYLAQHSYARIEGEWVELPGAVFGSASDADVVIAGDEAVRRAFLRYLDTVRVKPKDIHVHYNDWWTAPVPSSEDFVLANIARLKEGLYDQTGFFFDSYALDAGWSNTHSVWEIDPEHFPEGFERIRQALAEVGSRPGLWISPSSLYPFTLDNRWLESAGYEATPHARLGYNACLGAGGRYQRAFKAAALKYAHEANLAHMKFDGYIPSCDVEDHGHPRRSGVLLAAGRGTDRGLRRPARAGPGYRARTDVLRLSPKPVVADAHALHHRPLRRRLSARLVPVP
ncbi:MAG TPA: hypothetical protein ENN80_06190 [Candidatus Hydrogenedentes bacterium]|nr:hypothetical protein [Candidatus Hydrogenedentota bacterium]